MSTKIAFVWGPVSNFSSIFLYLLLESGWQLHIASKSPLRISFSPLDLTSAAWHAIEEAAGGIDKLRPHLRNLVFLESDEPRSGIKYDMAVFMGLPANFDESRIPRAPRAAEEFAKIVEKLKDVPVIVFSSLWGGIQEDGVVPEEIKFKRRHPKSYYESVCQRYEALIHETLSREGRKWHLVRLPQLLGNLTDGRTAGFGGFYKLFEELQLAKLRPDADRSRGREAGITRAGSDTERDGGADLDGEKARDGAKTRVSGKGKSREIGSQKPTLALNFSPEATLPILPCDWVASLIAKLIDDPALPDVCNLVATPSILNKDWTQQLARALGLSALQASEQDDLRLPATLRSMLTDNIQIRSGKLFELGGLYQQSPVKMTSYYFGKILNYAASHNWGRYQPGVAEEPTPEKILKFFEEFLPARIDRKMLKLLAELEGGLAFQVTGRENRQWLLCSQDGKATITLLDGREQKPQVVLQASSSSFARLASGKLSAEEALESKALQVTGDFVQSARAFGFFHSFLKKNRYRC